MADLGPTNENNDRGGIQPSTETNNNSCSCDDPRSPSKSPRETKPQSQSHSLLPFGRKKTTPSKEDAINTDTNPCRPKKTFTAHRFSTVPKSARSPSPQLQQCNVSPLLLRSNTDTAIQISQPISEPMSLSSSLPVPTELGPASNIPARPAKVCIIEGYLSKQGARRKTWKRRWFQAFSDNLLCRLSYARSEGEEPIRVITLSPGCRVYMGFCGKNAEQLSLKHPVLFSIETTSRVFCLEAAVSEEARRWVDSINSQLVLIYKDFKPFEPKQKNSTHQPMQRTRAATIAVSSPEVLTLRSDPQTSDTFVSFTSPVVSPTSPAQLVNTNQQSPPTEPSSLIPSLSVTPPEATSPQSCPSTPLLLAPNSFSPCLPALSPVIEDTPRTLPPVAPQPPFPCSITSTGVLENTLSNEEETRITNRIAAKFPDFSPKETELYNALNKLGDPFMLRVVPGSLSHSIVCALGQCNLQWGLALGEHCVLLAPHMTVPQSTLLTTPTNLSEIRVYFSERSGQGPESLSHFSYVHTAFSESISRLMFAQHYFWLAKMPMDSVLEALHRFLQPWASLLTNVALYLEHTQNTDSETCNQTRRCSHHLTQLAFQKTQIDVWLHELCEMQCNWFGFLYIREPTPDENFARTEGKEVQGNQNTLAGNLPSACIFTALTPSSIIFYNTQQIGNSLYENLPPILSTIPLTWIRKLDIVTQHNSFMKLTNFITAPSPEAPLITHILYASGSQETELWLSAITNAFQALMVSQNL
ncbi:hypothetical protein Pelo_12754 [Pelomyxa schiedti]|nr:hypothetical protein Pelo_12754 [Pelomyxa schiedti]